jgi:hypothetical protein
MGFITTPITNEEARQLVKNSEGEVVSASNEKYLYNLNKNWLLLVAKAEIADDSITIFFTLINGDFVEYCCVNSDDRTTRKGEIKCEPTKRN